MKLIKYILTSLVCASSAFAEFPYQTYSYSSNGTPSSKPTAKDFSWTFPDYTTPKINASFSIGPISNVIFRIGKEDGPSYLTAYGTTTTGTNTSYTTIISRSNMPPNGTYAAQFLGADIIVSGSNTWYEPARVLARGEVVVNWTTFSATNQTSFTNQNGVLILNESDPVASANLNLASNYFQSIAGGNATNGVNSITNIGSAVVAAISNSVITVISTNAATQADVEARLSSNVWAAAGSTTNYAKRSDGRLAPLYGIGNAYSDGGHAAINNMNTRIDLRSSNRLHEVLGIYANNSTGMFPNTSIPGIALWNYGETATEPFAAGTRTASLSFGLHNATSAPAMWRLFGVASGTNDMVGDLLFTSQDQSAAIFERARITYDGGIIASGTVVAANILTNMVLNGTNHAVTGKSVDLGQTGAGGGGAGDATWAQIVSSNYQNGVQTSNAITRYAVGTNGGLYEAQSWAFGNVTADKPVLFIDPTTIYMQYAAGNASVQLSSGSIALNGGVVSGNGAGLTSLTAANIASNTPIQLGTGTVTAAGFIGNGAGLTNLSPLLPGLNLAPYQVGTTVTITATAAASAMWLVCTNNVQFTMDASFPTNSATAFSLSIYQNGFQPSFNNATMTNLQSGFNTTTNPQSIIFFRNVGESVARGR